MEEDKIKKNHRIKNISTLTFASISGSAISGLFWLYLADLLGAENYGEIGYLLAIGAISAVIAMWGSEKAIIVYTAKGIPIQSSIYFISIFTSITTAVILYLMFQSIGLSFYVLGYVIYNLAISELLGWKLYKTYSIFFILQKVLFVIFSISLFFVIGLEGILVGMAISFVPFVYRVIVDFKNISLNFSLLKQKRNFIANNYLVDLTKKLTGRIDILLIGPLYGFTLVGNYFLGFQILSLLSIIPGIIFKYTLPEDSTDISTTKLKFITILVSVILVVIAIITAPILLPIIYPEYVESLELIPIMSLAVIPTTISNMVISKLLGNEQSKYVLIGWVVSLSTLVVGVLVLGEIWDVTGLAIAYVLAYSVQAIYFVLINNYWNKKRSQFNFT